MQAVFVDRRGYLLACADNTPLVYTLPEAVRTKAAVTAYIRKRFCELRSGWTATTVPNGVVVDMIGEEVAVAMDLGEARRETFRHLLGADPGQLQYIAGEGTYGQVFRTKMKRRVMRKRALLGIGAGAVGYGSYRLLSSDVWNTAFDQERRQLQKKSQKKKQKKEEEEEERFFT